MPFMSLDYNDTRSDWCWRLAIYLYNDDKHSHEVYALRISSSYLGFA